MILTPGTAIPGVNIFIEEPVMSKTIDALKTAIDTLSKIIDDLKAENSSLKSEIRILEGKLAIAEMKIEERKPLSPSVPTFPSPTYPTWPTCPPNNPFQPWIKEPYITWTDKDIPVTVKPTFIASNKSEIKLGRQDTTKMTCYVQ